MSTIESPDTASLAEQLALVTLERDILRQQLEEARAREANLMHLCEQLSGARDRQAPARPIVPPQHGPRLASAMRQQILSVLQRYPRGLHRKHIQEELGTDRDIANILGHMKRDHLLVHKGSGIYALAGEEATTPA
jgi:hypothetical protein